VEGRRKNKRAIDGTVRLILDKKPKQKAKSGGRKSAQAVAENVHQMPTGSRRRAAPAEEPVAFPSVSTIVANASRAAVATDKKNRILHWNDAAIELFEFTAEEAIGRNFQQVTQARDVNGNRLAIDHGSFPQSFEIAIITATGKMIWIGTSLVVVLGPQTGEYALVYLMTPMHRRRRADEAIDRLLTQADLPGVTVPGIQMPTGAEQRGTSEQPHLTRRQLEVLLLLAEGKTSGEIAEELIISVHTVRTHIQGILRTLGAANRLEAVSRALHERII
jgi:PAS domain S-box-containing protein